MTEKKIITPENTLKLPKKTIFKKLIGPPASITEASKGRYAMLVSSLTLSLAVMMIVGVIYMSFFSSIPIAGFFLTIADVIFIFAYILSRTKHYEKSVFICIATLLLIPVANVSFAENYTSESLIILLIWNILTILISSVLTSYFKTILIAVINIATITSFFLIIPVVRFSDITIPLIFNIIISVTVIVITRHRNMIENDRMSEISLINEQLTSELSERERVESELAYSATHDELTGLPNRIIFMDRLQHIIDYFKRHKDQKYAVLFLDLDRFKIVNDTLGHEAGDQLLVKTAERLSICVRDQDTVSRFGGDEFIILLEDINNEIDATHIAERIRYDMSVPFFLKDHEMHLSASIGIVIGKDEYESPEHIIRDADIAMYRAKRTEPGNYEIFDPEMLKYVQKRLSHERDLRKAIERKEFVLYYQPIYNTVNKQITGFEALIRWEHPEKGIIEPADFIPVAEETGLIIPIGYWVINEACRQIHDWQLEFPTQPQLTISVNLSSRQCSQPDLVQQIEVIIKNNNIKASSLKMELTESLIVKDPEATSLMLSKLREMGVEVQIDDFGTGYSALGYLHSLPIDTLKIDRTFINRLDSIEGSDIVKTIMSMAHNLGMKVVAEGVETGDQFSALNLMNCEYIQGFLLAKPVSGSEAGSLLKKELKTAE